MEPKEYLQILKKRWLLIFIITLSAVIISAGASYFVIKPIYKSDISVIIGKVGTGTDTSSQPINYSDVLMYQMLVKTYSELAKSRMVSENAIDKLKLNMKPEELQKMISVSPKGDTEFLTISVKSKNAEGSMVLANQLAISLKEVGVSVKKMDNVQILDPALLPAVPYSPKPTLNISVALFLGLIISVGLAFMLDYLDNTVKIQEDIEKLVGIPVIGVIPSDAEIK